MTAAPETLLRRIYDSRTDWADQLQGIQNLRHLLNERERELVYEMRLNAVSWQKIADALGVKHRQQIQAKFHAAPPPPGATFYPDLLDVQRGDSDPTRFRFPTTNY